MNLSDAWDYSSCLTLVPLPTIDDLRAQLYRDPYTQAVEAICPHTVKQLPLRIINSSIDATYQHLQSIVDGSPGANLSATLHQLWSQSTALITQFATSLPTSVQC